MHLVTLATTDGQVAQHSAATGSRPSCKSLASPRKVKACGVYSEHTQIGTPGGYARASDASGGGGASRVPRIADDVTVGSAHVSCVLVSYTPCAERRRF